MRSYIYNRNSVIGSQAEHCGMRTYFFSADTQEDMSGWIRAMNQAALMQQSHAVKRSVSLHEVGLTSSIAGMRKSLPCMLFIEVYAPNTVLSCSVVSGFSVLSAAAQFLTAQAVFQQVQPCPSVLGLSDVVCCVCVRAHELKQCTGRRFRYSCDCRVNTAITTVIQISISDEDLVQIVLRCDGVRKRSVVSRSQCGLGFLNPW